MKVCSVCQISSSDITTVQYECKCVKRLCKECYRGLPPASEDFCEIHLMDTRKDLKQLRKNLQHVPYEM